MSMNVVKTSIFQVSIDSPVPIVHANQQVTIVPTKRCVYGLMCVPYPRGPVAYHSEESDSETETSDFDDGGKRKSIQRRSLDDEESVASEPVRKTYVAESDVSMRSTVEEPDDATDAQKPPRYTDYEMEQINACPDSEYGTLEYAKVTTRDDVVLVARKFTDPFVPIDSSGDDNDDGAEGKVYRHGQRKRRRQRRQRRQRQQHGSKRTRRGMFTNVSSDDEDDPTQTHYQFYYPSNLFQFQLKNEYMCQTMYITLIDTDHLPANDPAVLEVGAFSILDGHVTHQLSERNDFGAIVLPDTHYYESVLVENILATYPVMTEYVRTVLEIPARDRPVGKPVDLNSEIFYIRDVMMYRRRMGTTVPLPPTMYSLSEPVTVDALSPGHVAPAPTAQLPSVTPVESQQLLDPKTTVSQWLFKLLQMLQQMVSSGDTLPSTGHLAPGITLTRTMVASGATGTGTERTRTTKGAGASVIATVRPSLAIAQLLSYWTALVCSGNQIVCQLLGDLVDQERFLRSTPFNFNLCDRIINLHLAQWYHTTVERGQEGPTPQQLDRARLTFPTFVAIGLLLQKVKLELDGTSSQIRDAIVSGELILRHHVSTYVNPILGSLKTRLQQHVRRDKATVATVDHGTGNVVPDSFDPRPQLLRRAVTQVVQQHIAQASTNLVLASGPAILKRPEKNAQLRRAVDEILLPMIAPMDEATNRLLAKSHHNTTLMLELAAGEQAGVKDQYIQITDVNVTNTSGMFIAQ